MSENSTNVRTLPQSREVNYRPPKTTPWLRRLSKVTPSFAAWLGAYWFTRPRHFARPEREQALLATGVPFELEGGVNAWSFGSGPLVILVHGWEGRGAQLGAFVSPLVAAGFRVVTFDVRAHGSSPGTHATIVSWLPPLFEISERFGEPACVIAHSFGCPAVSLALKRGYFAKSVVYVAPPDALDAGARTFARVTGIGERGEAALKQLLSRRTGMLFADQRVANFGASMNTPLLVVHDENDADVPLACAKTYARHWPDCRVFTTRGLGHRKILRDPTVVNHVLTFVASHQQSASVLDRWLDAAHHGCPLYGATSAHVRDVQPTPA
jgi:pimeloyl-ACP methyl ester carboxylesterase